MTDTTLDKVTALVADAAEKPSRDIKPTTNLIDDLSLDELDRTELKNSLEQEFSIRIEETEAEKLKTVDDIVQYLKPRI